MIDSGAVAEAAFRLWRERGFRDTSWADLADATGVSTRTLLRHFPTKADIAWIGVPRATARLRDALAATSPTSALDDAIRTGVVSSVSHDPRVQRVNPAWLRLIAGEPELIAMAPAAYRPWIDELAGFIKRRVPAAPQAVCRALASAYQAAAFAALTEWADAGAQGDSADAVDAMLAWIDIRIPDIQTGS
ncbi:TetR/AcrR family transcriptional regulator [Gordonia jinghuaiqii]|uniref:TetR/AcrR family transcriptional regulator n=1 Tax=Gordonia jinghuaiqii TaxID=2758710 RepID=UPI001FD1830E|nr:TetR/AcrR family transcriptional regulator [Gordonia jinghuaiqii]